MNDVSDLEATMWFLYGYVVRKNISHPGCSFWPSDGLVVKKKKKKKKKEKEKKYWTVNGVDELLKRWE